MPPVMLEDPPLLPFGEVQIEVEVAGAMLVQEDGANVGWTMGAAARETAVSMVVPLVGATMG